ncbi:MAG: single-stranded DNA-binding protein [Actinomycetota bacterium]|nr:single-stranded DNA-binding protein [Actinomycetota bacterium]
MSDTFVTFHGWVGNDVSYRDPNGVRVANFRVASTPRIKRKGDWMDGDTTWYSVSAWRGLADNVRESVKKGDAVIVHGRLRSETWTREDGHASTTMVVEASLVGHDLTRGTSVFVRSSRPERNDSDPHDEIQDMVHRESDDLTPMDSWGNPKVSGRGGERTEEPAEESAA